MIVYARSPWRLARQVTSDVFAVAWSLTWWQVGRFADTSIRALALPARVASSAAESVRAGLADAAAATGRLPVFGDDVRKPLDVAAGGVAQMASSAADQVAAIERVAGLTGALTFVIPVALWLLLWLPARIRFVRNATASARFVDSGADVELFALRAMATQPLWALAKISPDPVTEWRSGNREVIDRLARLELDREGLQAPS